MLSKKQLSPSHVCFSTSTVISLETCSWKKELLLDLNDIHLKHTGKARAAWLLPVNKTNAMSTSMSQPNRRAECENARDLFFWKQWNWGGLPAATSTALRLPCTACSNPSSPKTQHSQQLGVCQQNEGQQPSLGIPRCNIVPVFLNFCHEVFVFTCNGCAGHGPGI